MGITPRSEYCISADTPLPHLIYSILNPDEIGGEKTDILMLKCRVRIQREKYIKGELCSIYTRLTWVRIGPVVSLISEKFGHTYSFKGFSLFFTIFNIVE